MVFFQAVNNDVLHCVLQVLDVGSLLALASTCQRFTVPCRKLLWQTVNIDISSQRAEQFIKQLEQQREYTHCIKDITIRGIELPKGLQQRADTILNELANVNRLHLQRPFDRWNPYIGPPKEHLRGMDLIKHRVNAVLRRPEHLQQMLRSFTNAGALRVHKVELAGDFTSLEISTVMSMEGLQSLRVTGLTTVAAPQRATFVAAQSLRELWLKGSTLYNRFWVRPFAEDWYLESSTLHCFTSVLGQLESLEIWLPHAKDQAFSATALTQSLKPLQSHLKRLVLTDNFSLQWTTRLDGRLSLQSFKCLEYLEAVPICWFVARGPELERLELAKLLPCSLVELKLLFNLDEGAFFTPTEVMSIGPRDVEMLPHDSRRWGWISALTALPKLHRIIIEEETLRRSERGIRIQYSWVTWSTSVSKRNNSETPYVALKADLRIQRPTKTPSHRYLASPAS